jgi:hypothetical protein
MRGAAFLVVRSCFGEFGPGLSRGMRFLVMFTKILVQLISMELRLLNERKHFENVCVEVVFELSK